MPCSKTQCSAAGEAQAHKPSISSQALNHCAPYFVYSISNICEGGILLGSAVQILNTYWDTKSQYGSNQNYQTRQQQQQQQMFIMHSMHVKQMNWQCMQNTNLVMLKECIFRPQDKQIL